MARSSMSVAKTCIPGGSAKAERYSAMSIAREYASSPEAHPTDHARQMIVRAFAGEQLRNDLLCQVFKRIVVAKKLVTVIRRSRISAATSSGCSRMKFT